MLFVVFFVGLLLIAAIVLGSYVFIHFLLPIFIGILALASLCAYFGIGTKLEWAIYDRIPQLKILLIVLAFTAVIIFVAGFFQDKTKVDGSATENTERAINSEIVDRGSEEMSVEMKSSWVALTDKYDIGDGAEISFKEYGLRLFNFGDTAMISVDLKDNALTNLEADYGFSIIITDSDTAWVSAYDNTDDGIVPLEISVQRWDGDYQEPFYEESVKISGFKEAPDGLGFVNVSFSNGDTLELGIFKQGNELKAFNLSLTQ